MDEPRTRAGRTARTSAARSSAKSRPKPKSAAKPKNAAKPKPKSAAKPKADAAAKRTAQPKKPKAAATTKKRSSSRTPASKEASKPKAAAAVAVEEPILADELLVGDEVPDQATSQAETEAPAQPGPAEADQRRVSAFRRRLYRVPVLGWIAYLIAPPRQRRASAIRRVISSASALLAIGGTAMVLYPVAGTHYPGFVRIPVEKGIEWSNVISDLESNRLQDKLKGSFSTLAAAPATPVKPGQPLTRLEMPKLGVDTIVVEGTSPSALKAGAGHYPQTPLPGQPGNVAIAGHRTTYGRPFNRVDELRTGDLVVLTTPVGRYTYQVARSPWVTGSADWSVVAPTPDATLTLTTCHPKGSDRQRLIVRATLVKTEPPVRQKAA